MNGLSVLLKSVIFKLNYISLDRGIISLLGIMFDFISGSELKLSVLSVTSYGTGVNFYLNPGDALYTVYSYTDGVS